jgi:adenylate cyclase
VAGARRLAAIMFTDMVGFSRLAQEDESAALRVRQEQQALLRPLFKAHGGREVKSLGDGFLVEFPSAVESVGCAIDIQAGLERRNSGRPEAERLLVRIGIHVGDVVPEGGDVVGDAVNVASRIEPLAEPGGILVSAQVLDQVRNKLPTAFEWIGQRLLKNIETPVGLYRVTQPSAESAPPPTAESPNRIAVLPFANLSPDPQDEFFADGLTEELITELSRIRILRVISRTSVMRYKGASKGAADIARELRVKSIVEGSVRRVGNRIRISAQLIDGPSEEHLWAATFDRELTDVFAVQSEIARQVAATLNLGLPSTPAAVRSPTASLDAYKAYVVGRALWNRRAPELVRAALRQFDEALRLDPTFALAYSGVADCYSILINLGQLRWAEFSGQARTAARRAIELDDSSAEGHASLGLALMNDLEWSGSERELRRAVELNPAYAAPRLWIYLLLMDEGRDDEAVRELHLAEDADPLSPRIAEHLGIQAWLKGRENEALEWWDRAATLGAGADAMLVLKVGLLTRVGRLDEARALLEKTPTPPVGFVGAVFPALMHALLGRREEAYRDLARLQAKESEVLATQLAWVYGALADNDRFYEALSRFVREKGGDTHWIWVLPIFEEARKDPRFAAFLRQCGLLKG